MIRRSRLIDGLPLLAMPLLASCVAPRVVQAPVREAMPAVVALPAEPRGHDWTDGPITPGSWRYAAAAGSTMAAFSSAGSPPLFAMRCTGAGIVLVRAGAAAAMTITTSSVARLLPIGADGAARLPSRDAFLDAMAFSRGRLMVQAAAQPPLILPAQAEIGRVVEDCRG